MTRLQALQSITSVPARILGIEDRLGSIEAGKEATLVLADGDLLESTARVYQSLGCRPEDLTGRPPEQLYEKYRTRPKG